MSTAKQQHHATSDRISNLPQNVTQQILECLPLQQASRTSVLSKYWRIKWASTSQLILDESFVKCICEKRSEHSDKLLAYNKAVNDILLSHAGPIGKFVLYIPNWFPRGTDFSSWLRFVYGNGVKEITLENDRPPVITIFQTKIPSCYLSFVRLTHLTLINCRLRSFPSTYRGFPCLITLEFDTRDSLILNQPQLLINLISKCPLLERLHLSFYSFNGNMIIRASKLREFVFRAQKVINVSLVGTRAIEVLSLHTHCGTLQGSQSITDFFSCLANVEKLSLRLFNFTDFASPKILPKSLTRLQVLELKDIALNCDSGFSLTLCFLLSSPNLERLHIEAVNDEAESDGQLSMFDDTCVFRHLKTVHLVGITGLSNELQLIRFLLACSPLLEKLTIELSKKIGGAEEQVNFFKELNQYRRASTNIEMMFKT